MHPPTSGLEVEAWNPFVWMDENERIPMDEKKKKKNDRDANEIKILYRKERKCKKYAV